MIKRDTNSIDEDVPSEARHGVGEHTSSAVCVNLSKLWERVASMIELYGVFYKLITITQTIIIVYVANSPTNWYVNNRRQDREKNSLPSIDSCPFLWTAHRFLLIEQNRVTPADTVWSFNWFSSSWFYQRFYALETDSIIYSKIVTCLIEWRVHLISLHSDGCF